MANRPMSVAFVGTGDTTEANVKANLDDWMSEQDADGKDRAYNPPIIPDQIKRAHKGLMRCWDWLTDAFGKEIERMEPDQILDELIAARDDESAPSDVYLVFVPGEEDDPYLPLVKAAIEAGIPVKNICLGLIDFELPEDEDAKAETEPEEPKTTRRTRGKSRTAEPEAAEPSTPVNADTVAYDDPPWDTSGDAEKPADAPGSADVQTPAPAPEKPATAIVAPPSAAPADGVAVVLSQATIGHLMAALASLAQDIGVAVHAQVVAELPAAEKPAPKMVAVYVNTDGEYRRVGKGRKRNDETRTEITQEQADELGL